MGEMIPFQERMGKLQSFLGRNRDAIAMAVPAHVNPDRMIRSVLTAVEQKPELMNCDPRSLFGAALTASQLGLEFNRPFGAWPIPFKDTKRNKTVCNLIIDYRGLMQLARNTRAVSVIETRCVLNGEKFFLRTGQPPHHEADITATPRPPGHPEGCNVVGVYMTARLEPSAAWQTEWMTLAQIEAVRARAKAGGGGPWTTDWVPMARKTVLRGGCKYLPQSVELLRAVTLDERGEVESQELETEVILPAEATVRDEPAATPSPRTVAEAAPAAKPEAPKAAPKSRKPVAATPAAKPTPAPAPSAAPAPAEAPEPPADDAGPFPADGETEPEAGGEDMAPAAAGQPATDGDPDLI